MTGTLSFVLVKVAEQFLIPVFHSPFSLKTLDPLGQKKNGKKLSLLEYLDFLSLKDRKSVV